MTESVVQDSPLKPLLGRVMVARQLTSIGAKALDDIGPGRQLLSLFLAGTTAARPWRRKSAARLGLPSMQRTF